MRIVLGTIEIPEEWNEYTHLERNDWDTFVIMLTTIKFPPYLGACWYNICLAIPVQLKSIEDLPEP